MNRDVKAIAENYDQGINHTTTKNTPYSYKAVDYSFSREEQQESPENTKKRISLELNNMLERAKRGLPEDYQYIFINLKTLAKYLTEII